MTIHNIIIAGTPKLRHPSQPVDPAWFSTQLANKLVEDLLATMKARNGVGLAAPQIGIPLRVVVYGFEVNSRYPDQDPVPVSILINPEIMNKSKDIVYLYEGCLSMPEVRGLVPRFQWLEIKAQDVNGKWFEKRVEGFEARIIQHEMDHLDGKLYPERMDNMRTLGYTAALKEAGLIR